MTARATKLQVALAEPTLPEDSGPIRALRLGIQTFLGEERIDMSAMARELDVNRATLYRWVGSRDLFMVEMLWWLTVRTLRQIEGGVYSTGSERIIQITIEYAQAVIENPGMKHWLATEGEGAMTLLTRYETGFQPRLIDWIAEALEAEIEAGNMDLPVEPTELAYVVERVMAGYIYLDLITGEQPDARRAEPILRLLFR